MAFVPQRLIIVVHAWKSKSLGHWLSIALFINPRLLVMGTLPLSMALWCQMLLSFETWCPISRRRSPVIRQRCKIEWKLVMMIEQVLFCFLFTSQWMVAGGREKPQIETSLLPWPSLPHHYFESFEFCYRDLSPAGQEGVWEQQPSVLTMPLGFQCWIYFGLVGIHFNPNLRAILQSYPGKQIIIINNYH